MLTAWRQRLAASLSLTSLALDGPFGHHHALPMARHGHVPLIAQLRSDSALYWPATGLYAGRGPHCTSGSNLAYRRIPEPYLNATTVAGPLQTCIYQAQLLH